MLVRPGKTRLVGQVPTALFPMALGLSGLGAAYLALGQHLSLDGVSTAGKLILVVGALVLAADTLLYLSKIAQAPMEFAAEFKIATNANLIAPAFMSAAVLSAQWAKVWPPGIWLWAVAVGCHVFLLLRFAGRWLRRNYEPADLNPTWFLPAAGLMVGSMTWPDTAPTALGWFIFAAGASLWIMLLPPIFRRLVFEPPIMPMLRPTLFIVAAPFGLAANSILTLAPTGAPVVPAIFAFAGTFFILILLFQPRFIAQAGVSLTWWATTFPVATVALAIINLSNRPNWDICWLAITLLSVASLFTLIAIGASLRVGWTVLRQNRL